MGELVTLNHLEMAFAERIGEIRQERRDTAGDKNAHGSRAGVEDHILGARGELAFAKFAGLYPSGLFLKMDEDDDVSGIQVRTRRQHSMDLYLWKRDNPTHTFVLMTGEGPSFQFHGFIHGADATKEKFWTPAFSLGNFPRVSCWVIPQASLRKEIGELS